MIITKGMGIILKTAKKKWAVHYRGNPATTAGGKTFSKMEKRIFNSKEEADKTAARKKMLGVEDVSVKKE
tara:strand:- start:11 stop:220 length:210 start_codon:yes stop_codon:yes gene_type:complete